MTSVPLASVTWVQKVLVVLGTAVVLKFAVRMGPGAVMLPAATLVKVVGAVVPVSTMHPNAVTFTGMALLPFPITTACTVRLVVNAMFVLVRVVIATPGTVLLNTTCVPSESVMRTQKVDGRVLLTEPGMFTLSVTLRGLTAPPPMFV